MTARVSLEPTAVHRVWWIWTEPIRLLIRLVTERFLRQSTWVLLASAARLGAHLAVGNPWWAALVVLVAVTPLTFWPGVAAGLVVETGLWVLRRQRGGVPTPVSSWRLGWKVHRTWPRAFTDTAAKTREIQSFDAGRGGETRAAAVRPVVDHPRMPWRFWVRWPVITFRVGVAPGRTFRQLEQIMPAMAANMPWVHSIELEYATDRSSFGLIHFALADVLANPDLPDWRSTRHLRIVNDNDDQEDGDGQGEGVA
ncbi:MAG: hypothetical protein AAGA93_00595 [Actinomycetota bacterium]